MAAARPVVFACESAYDPIATTGAGVTVQPDDPGLLAQALLALAETDPEERTSMGHAGRAYVVREHEMQTIGARTHAALCDLSPIR